MKGYELFDELHDLIMTEKNLPTEMSEVDHKITDILHYIEFTDLDVRRGYKIYKMLQEVLRDRREIKNRQSLYDSMKAHGISLKNVESVIQKINQINHLHYTPRIMNELFEGKEI